MQPSRDVTDHQGDRCLTDQPDQVPTQIERQLQSNAQDVRQTLTDLFAELRASQIGDDALATAETVLAEVLNNVVEHAYEERDGGKIFVTIAVDNLGLSCTVADHGKAMPNNEVPGGAAPDASGPLETLPEGGFGWFLIHSLTEDLTYTRLSSQNVLNFRLPR
ncbi:ATP-binding protein [Actibacterium sp. 188UL27-1]|uniref:ATP-binding protein n=1 Tax=Actibacterium sp. 188UL27-1 TaxID=2786961 RepID=UPI00195E1810|nr:ATP-binding protein [Actibacterium sp. 188UL27-1]MBM7066020.1 ATP-binding protein [Actibacterium sp. 188UL27-1]